MQLVTVSYDLMEGEGRDGAQTVNIRNALNIFFQGVERRAYRMAYIATYNREDALDLVQDAMLRLARNYAQRPNEEWAPLFHRILQHRITDWHRKRKVEQWFGSWFGRSRDEDNQPEPSLEIEDVRFEPGRTVFNSQALSRLDEVLHELPLRQQQAFLLRAWEGLDVQQTAEAMGCSAGSVKTHYSRAIHTVREKLEGYWP
ncbi:MAG: RNA polymerase sigma factor [Gammaproteobacteria bacterium]|nr:RNA polymerase sigma factor [Gammaproteobacteria bacterium]